MFLELGRVDGLDHGCVAPTTGRYGAVRPFRLATGLCANPHS